MKTKFQEGMTTLDQLFEDMLLARNRKYTPYIEQLEIDHKIK